MSCLVLSLIINCLHKRISFIFDLHFIFMNKIISCLFFFLLLTSTIFAQKKSKLPCLDKEFSVVVHIVKDSLGNPGISETSVKGLFGPLNDTFDSICASFKVCEIRYIDNFMYDTLNQDDQLHMNQLQQQYHAKNRINIYFVTHIRKPKGAAGFAGLGMICNMESDGIVLQKTASTLTLQHEMGHYFGLNHTWHNKTDIFKKSEELVNGTNCLTESDDICDTPADPFIKGTDPESYVNQDCRFINSSLDANGQYYDPIVGNTMSYYPERCNCGFTHEQYMKMAKTYLSNPTMW